MLNAYWEPLDFELPPGDDGQPLAWRRWVDTSLPSPDDVVDRVDGLPVAESSYRVGPRSIAMLLTGPGLDPTPLAAPAGPRDDLAGPGPGV
jgi:glycogen operon protein